MKFAYYLISTLLLFALQAYIAIIVDSIDDVFDFVAAIAVTCLGFGFPSIFYLIGEKYQSRNRLDIIDQFAEIDKTE